MKKPKTLIISGDLSNLPKEKKDAPLTKKALQQALDLMSGPKTKKQLEREHRIAKSQMYFQEIIKKAMDMNLITRKEGLIMIALYTCNGAISVKTKRKLQPAIDALK